MQRRGFTLIKLIEMLELLTAVLLTAVLRPAVQNACASAHQTIGRNEPKQPGLALHNYHQARSTFPPGAMADRENLQPVRHSGDAMLQPNLDKAETQKACNFDERGSEPENRFATAAIRPGINGCDDFTGSLSVAIDSQLRLSKKVAT